MKYEDVRVFRGTSYANKADGTYAELTSSVLSQWELSSLDLLLAKLFLDIYIQIGYDPSPSKPLCFHYLLSSYNAITYYINSAEESAVKQPQKSVNRKRRDVTR
jgi:hypothetical protein